MITGDWISLAGVLALLVLAGLGAFWRLNHAVTDKISVTAKVLHEKIEEVRRDYVRRDDLRDDIQRLEQGQTSLSNKMDGMVNSMVPAMARLTEAAISLRDKN